MNARMLRCEHCGTQVTLKDRKCPNCGKSIRVRVPDKRYSGVFQQQGRVEVDDDWDEATRIQKVTGHLKTVKCESCGEMNIRTNRTCNNCGAVL